MLVRSIIAKSIALLLALAAVPAIADHHELVAPGAKLIKLAGGFRFTEGPACAPNGDVYFTDIPNNRIHKWDVTKKKISTFMEESGGANGMYFMGPNWIYVCQGDEKRVASINIGKDGKPMHVLAVVANYNRKPFNKPNDLWVDRKGGIYFTDPNYSRGAPSQGGEHVYFIGPKGGKAIRVADDFQRPNGIVGTADGKTLYIADRNANKTYRYRIASPGKLADKTKHCDEGSDGMTLDANGNLYITPKANAVHVYSPAGKLIKKIATPKPASNLTFGGKDRKTLFITSRDAFYSIEMSVKGQ